VVLTACLAFADLERKLVPTLFDVFKSSPSKLVAAKASLVCAIAFSRLTGTFFLFCAREQESDEDEDSDVVIRVADKSPRKKKALVELHEEEDQDEDDEPVSVRISAVSPAKKRMRQAAAMAAAMQEAAAATENRRVNRLLESQEREKDGGGVGTASPESSVGGIGSVPLAEIAFERQERQISPEVWTPLPRNVRSMPPQLVAKKRTKTPSEKKRKQRQQQPKPNQDDEEQERLRKAAEKIHFREAMAQLEALKKPSKRHKPESAAEKGDEEKEVEVPPPAPAPVVETLYQVARRKLQGRNALVGRRKEEEEIAGFVLPLLKSQRGGTLYVSGPSGVGKSLTVSCVAARVRDEKLSRRILTINLASEKIGCLMTRVAELLAPQRVVQRDEQVTAFAAARSVVESVCQSRPVLLVLEEVDQKSHVRAVCELFAIAGRAEKSQLVLIGIGNKRTFVTKNKIATDKGLTFAAYNADELIEIMTEKLSQEVCAKLVEPGALKLWAGKVTEHMGDLRSATACLVKAIDIAEADYLSKQPMPAEPVKVGLRAMRTLLDGWGSAKDTLSNISGLAPSARILLIGLAKACAGTNGEFTEAEMRRVYCKLFHQDRPEPGQLRGLLGSLLDTPFVVADATAAKFCVKIDPSIVAQAIASDAALTAFVK
jgi:Cdc6-like AAA superfamily ATPase